VHQSADTDAVVTALLRGAYEFSGQKCSAASRWSVPFLISHLPTPIFFTVRSHFHLDQGICAGKYVERSQGQADRGHQEFQGIPLFASFLLHRSGILQLMSVCCLRLVIQRRWIPWWVPSSTEHPLIAASRSLIWPSHSPTLTTSLLVFLPSTWLAHVWFHSCVLHPGGVCDDSKGYFVHPTLVETNDPHGTLLHSHPCFSRPAPVP